MQSNSLPQRLARAEQFANRRAQLAIAADLGMLEGVAAFEISDQARARLAQYGPDTGSDFSPPCVDEPIVAPWVDSHIAASPHRRATRGERIRTALMVLGMVAFIVGSLVFGFFVGTRI